MPVPAIFRVRVSVPTVLCAVALAGCSDERSLGEYDEAGSQVSVGAQATAGSAGEGGSAGESGVEGSDDAGPRLDFDPGTGGDCEADGTCATCDAPPHTPCDSDPNNLATAIGLGCPGEGQFQVTVNGASAARGTMTKFGNTDEWLPTEGERYAVIGSGFVNELEPGPTVQAPCRDDVDGIGARDIGPHDPQLALPAPIVARDVGAVTCTEDPSLIGTGDCSNTIESELYWSPDTKGAMDYTEIRITTTVPDTASSFSFDLAYFTLEYPSYYETVFNDFFIGWLESDGWTGNISFDHEGDPISLNSGFLNFKDTKAGIEVYDNSPGLGTNVGRRDPVCDADPDVCEAPELWGTCMEGAGGTEWLTTTAAVTPGEEITVVFAIFDVEDGDLDSYVFLDNWRWGCEPEDPPVTRPVG